MDLDSPYQTFRTTKYTCCGVMMNWNASRGEDEELFVMGDIAKTHIFSIKVVFFADFI